MDILIRSCFCVQPSCRANLPCLDSNGVGVHVIKVGGLCKKILVAMPNEISALVGLDGKYVSWYSIPFVHSSLSV